MSLYVHYDLLPYSNTDMRLTGKIQGPFALLPIWSSSPQEVICLTDGGKMKHFSPEIFLQREIFLHTTTHTGSQHLAAREGERL